MLELCCTTLNYCNNVTVYVRSGTVAAVEADEAAELEGARVRVLSIVLVVNNVEADEADTAAAAVKQQMQMQQS